MIKYTNFHPYTKKNIIKNKRNKTTRHMCIKFAAAITFFSICTALYFPSTYTLHAADTANNTNISSPATGSSVTCFDDI